MNPHYPQVAARAGHRCEYCQANEVIFNFPFEVEHLIPPNRGGSKDETNFALACRSCNLFKSVHIDGIDDVTGELERLFDPRRDDWNEHFSVDYESGSIIGTTPIGRVTVARLRMNGAAQLEARKAVDGAWGVPIVAEMGVPP